MNIKDIEKSVHLADTLEDKIALSRLYANIVTGGKGKIYDAINLEKQLVKDSLYILDNIVLNKCDSNRILHVISEGYLTGGHTRLCEQLALMGEGNSDLLVTRQIEKRVICRLEKYFSKIFLIPPHNPEKAVIQQLKVLSKYDKVVMHIHPDDILLVISLGLLRQGRKYMRIYFVNHADHLFSFGKSLPDVMFQISNRGYQVDSTILNSNYKNTFLGIPVANFSKPSFNSTTKKFLMAGASYKMKPNSRFSAPKLVEYILTKNKEATFTIIGVNDSDYWWWPLKLKFKKRFVTYNVLDYVEYLEILKNSDVCVDTLPITGGTAFVEMYTLGLKPIGLNTGISGYTPLDGIKVNRINEIKYNRVEIPPSELYSLVESVHSIESVESRYLNALNGQLHEIPSCLGGKSNDMELFVRAGKVDLSGAMIKCLLGIRSLTTYQKTLLFYKNYKCYQLFLNIPLKMVSHLIKKIKKY